jgi:hypothetical protein
VGKVGLSDRTCYLSLPIVGQVVEEGGGSCPLLPGLSSDIDTFTEARGP